MECTWEDLPPAWDATLTVSDGTQVGLFLFVGSLDNAGDEESVFQNRDHCVCAISARSETWDLWVDHSVIR